MVSENRDSYHGNNFHFAPTFRTYQRVHLIDFLNKSRPAPSCRFVCYALHLNIREFISCLFGSCSVTIFCKAAVFNGLPLCPAGIQTVVAYQMFVFRGNVLSKFCDKIDCLENFYILTPILIILCSVNDILFNIKYFLQGIREDYRDALRYIG